MLQNAVERRLAPNAQGEPTQFGNREAEKKLRLVDYEGSDLKNFADSLTIVFNCSRLLAGGGIATGTLGTVITALGTASLGGPIGVGMALAATSIWLLGRRIGAEELTKYRQKLLDSLPGYAEQVINEYQEKVAPMLIREQIGRLTKAIDDEIERVNDAIESLEQRARNGEYTNRQLRIDALGYQLPQASARHRCIHTHCRILREDEPAYHAITIPRLGTGWRCAIQQHFIDLECESRQNRTASKYGVVSSLFHSYSP